MTSISLNTMDHIGPIIGALIFITLMGLLPEPIRRKYNAILVAGASGVYISGGGLGAIEVVFALSFSILAYKGLNDYRFIALGWIVHSIWDGVHHFYGNPIWPFMQTSSWGCLIFDFVIAIWFYLKAPSLPYYIVKKIKSK